MNNQNQKEQKNIKDKEGKSDESKTEVEEKKQNKESIESQENNTKVVSKQKQIPEQSQDNRDHNNTKKDQGKYNSYMAYLDDDVSNSKNLTILNENEIIHPKNENKIETIYTKKIVVNCYKTNDSKKVSKNNLDSESNIKNDLKTKKYSKDFFISSNEKKYPEDIFIGGNYPFFSANFTVIVESLNNLKKRDINIIFKKIETELKKLNEKLLKQQIFQKIWNNISISFGKKKSQKIVNITFYISDIASDFDEKLDLLFANSMDIEEDTNFSSNDRQI